MTKNRFFELRNNLHRVNNLETRPDCTDRFFKVRPIYDQIRKRMLELPMDKNVCVDEQMVPFRGQLEMKQYVKKGKPHPWGVKLFVLCSKSGLAYDFIIYQGSSTGLGPESVKNYRFGGALVLQLTKNLKLGHFLYFDNYFSSYNLLK